METDTVTTCSSKALAQTSTRGWWWIFFAENFFTSRKVHVSGSFSLIPLIRVFGKFLIFFLLVSAGAVLYRWLSPIAPAFSSQTSRRMVYKSVYNTLMKTCIRSSNQFYPRLVLRKSAHFFSTSRRA